MNSSKFQSKKHILASAAGHVCVFVCINPSLFLSLCSLPSSGHELQSLVCSGWTPTSSGYLPTVIAVVYSITIQKSTARTLAPEIAQNVRFRTTRTIGRPRRTSRSTYTGGWIPTLILHAQQEDMQLFIAESNSTQMKPLSPVSVRVFVFLWFVLALIMDLWYVHCYSVIVYCVDILDFIAILAYSDCLFDSLVFKAILTRHYVSVWVRLNTWNVCCSLNSVAHASVHFVVMTSLFVTEKMSTNHIKCQFKLHKDFF